MHCLLGSPFHFTLPKEGDVIQPLTSITPPLIGQLKMGPRRHSTPIGEFDLSCSVLQEKPVWKLLILDAGSDGITQTYLGKKHTFFWGRLIPSPHFPCCNLGL